MTFVGGDIYGFGKEAEPVKVSAPAEPKKDAGDKPANKGKK